MNVLVTGTDTGVGKTVIACALIRNLHNRQKRVGVYKPVETGCDDRLSGLWPHDANLLLRATSRSDLSLENVCPYRFKECLAPSEAAKRQGLEIQPRVLFDMFSLILTQSDLVVIEGAGGILVPITDNLDYATLAHQWGLGILVVVNNQLGCINHTRLTEHLLQSKGLLSLGFVLNSVSPVQDIAQQNNAQHLSRLLGEKFWGIIPYAEEVNVLQNNGVIDRLGHKLAAVLSK